MITSDCNFDAKSMKLLFVAAQMHMDGVGGDVTFTQACVALLRSAASVSALRVLDLSPPFGRLPRPLRQALALGRSALSDAPAKTHFAVRADAARCLRGAIEDWRPDMVVFNHGELMPLAHAVPDGIPIVLVAHKIEHRSLQAMTAALRGPPGLLRPLIRRDAGKLQRMEQRVGRRIGNVLCISGDCERWFAELGERMRVLAIPPLFGYPAWEGPHYCVKRWQLPAVWLLAGVVQLLEVPGMLRAMTDRPVGETVYR